MDFENMEGPLDFSKALQQYRRSCQLETEFLVGDYMRDQNYLSEWDRSVVINWMVKVSTDMDLPLNIMFSSVKVLDLYLNKTKVRKESLKLIGTSALMLCTKFEASNRTYPVDVFLFFCGEGRSRGELISMERQVFRTIEVNLNMPVTTIEFLNWYSMAVSEAENVLLVSRYILELSSMEYATVTILESKLAAAALFLATQILKYTGGWSTLMELHTGYNYCEIEPVVFLLNFILHKEPSKDLMAVRNKYPFSKNIKLLSNSEFIL